MTITKDTPRIPWYEDQTEISRLAHWMYYCGCLTDPIDLLDVVERPWHYQEDYDHMQQSQEDES